MLTVERFLELSIDCNFIRLSEEIICDTETPVTIYSKVCEGDDYSFLLESVGKGRYSFIGLEPEMVIKKKGNKIIVRQENQEEVISNCDYLNYLKDLLKSIKPAQKDETVPFSGGLVGYFSYDIVNEWEDIYHGQEKKLQQADMPLSILESPRYVIAIDHYTHLIKVIANVFIDNELSIIDKRELYHIRKGKIYDLIEQIKNQQARKKIHDLTVNEQQDTNSDFNANINKAEYVEIVNRAKEYIKAGDIFQIVLSQKFNKECELSPFELYRALRVTNPSPYLFYFNFPELKLIGSSPEILVEVRGNKVINRPLAGTRPRGANPVEDQLFSEDLLNDEKEKAEHIMLVDLGRNDLGRVCKTGSVEVTELMEIEQFSRVMHIVSQVEGQLKGDLTPLDVLKAVFPAGTVSGAPKIRAMELIDQLEKEARGIYAGAVGYCDFDGNMDMCIAIRTIYLIKEIVYLQVGAGIVVDSIGEKEYQETLNKASAIFQAINMSKGGKEYDCVN